MRKTKIYYGRDLLGRFTCDGRSYSKFQLFVYKLKRIAIRVVIAIIAIDVIGWSGVIGYHYAKDSVLPVTVFAEDRSFELFSNKVETLKNEVVDQLMKCESAGHKEDDGLIIFDTNSKASIGRAQFQIDTVIHYTKLLDGKNITRKEAILIALDDVKAKELAKKIMFDTKNMAGKDWVNCNKKLNLDQQIMLINKIDR